MGVVVFRSARILKYSGAEVLKSTNTRLPLYVGTL